MSHGAQPIRMKPYHLPLLIAFAMPAGVSHAEDIKPPFGLIWGESSERLERLLKNAKATIVEK